MRKLKCFIASAFDHKDVDTIFSKGITPVLKKLGIIALRVDKINHNSKIDKKIIELIQGCDFGIADLTYARPSVYYEAGFIEGLGKEVIYICKRDHFSPKPADKFGNEKIHFDLITKNIIPWTELIETFKKKLKSRITFIQKPLLKRENKSAEEVNSQIKFASLSLNKRLELIEQEVKAYLLKKRFRENKSKFHHNLFQKGNTRILVKVNETGTEGEIRYGRYADKELTQDGKFKVLKINCYIKPIPKSRIERALSFYTPTANNVYKWENITIKFIDSINSLHHLSFTLKNLELV